ncbi:DMT family transporter [Candidatus Microgenomates bacterium]|nr:DMT family transporter [Candidatus Microgenomates bacterium]
MSLFFALLTAFFWGCGDLFIAISSRKFGAGFSFNLFRIIAIVVLTIPAIIFFPTTNFTPVNLWTVIATSILESIGIRFFFKALAEKNAVINGTIASAFSIVTILVCLLFFGERPTVVQLFMIGLVIIGVIMASLNVRDLSKIHLVEKGALYAFAAMFIWGVYFAVVRIPTQELGWFWPVYFVRLTVILELPFIFSKKISLPKRLFNWKTVGLVVAAAVLPTIGDSFYNLGIAVPQTATSLFVPIASASPVIYVFLAGWFFREKIERIQKIGIATTILGVILLSIR